MQINIANSGPTMAASEPPEPPPRNPERINATLHKLAESKNIKSLDSSALNDKTRNNNKPLKTILSLDNTTTSTTAAGTTQTVAVAATTATLTTVAAAAVPTTSVASATPITAGSTKFAASSNNVQSPSATAAASALFYNKHKNQQQLQSPHNDLTPSGESITSPLSSNGSSHTLTSPMTIDNQQQQQQQHRLNFPYPSAKGNNSSSNSNSNSCSGGSGGTDTTTAIPHMTQQLNGGSQRSGVGGLLNEQQQNHHLANGSTGSAGSVSAGSASSTNSNHSNTSLNAANVYNSNNINSNNSPASGSNIHPTLVDKRNANNICPLSYNSGQQQQPPPLPPTKDTRGSHKTVDTKMATGPMTKVSSTTTTTDKTTSPSTVSQSQSMTATVSLSSSSSSSTFSNFNKPNSCDGNQNNEPMKSAQYHPDSPTKLREENERLNAELHRLRKLLETSPEGAVGGIDLSDSNSCGDGQSTDGSSSNTQQRIDRLEQELRSAKNQLMNLRIERKKLRSDKNELVGQVKQLCASLQEKEQELRDFIRNYQERVRESESNNAKLSGDRERERWQLLKQARDEAERSLSLAQQLSARDMQLQKLQEQLQRQMAGQGCMSDQESLLSFAPLTPPSAASGLMNAQMNSVAGSGAGGSGAGSAATYRNDDSGRGNSNSLSAFSNSSGNTAGDRNSCSNDSALRNNSDRESTGGDMNFSDGVSDNGPCITVDPDSISLVSSQNMYQYGTPKERSPTLSPLNSAAYSRSVEQLGSPVDSEGPGAVARKYPPKTSGTTLGARNGRGGTWGSISRVFARSRNKNKALSSDGASEFNDYAWSPLSEEGYAEKLRLLREASQLPMERWRASQVLAWLEVALGMPQYSSRCAENVKSGKVLLELNDMELEAGLGLAHPMHRKKLRLAIEEQRRPEMVRYPMITQLGHTWVASEWLPDIGLPQYAESFLHSLVDARMLDTLSKKELEKFLGVTRKFHQASIVHGIHVLRIVKYDRQNLAMRRVQSENVDTDPIVWTNQRFIRWARSIDLGEYADNLKDSGVHGGLVVLEPSFSGDTMATALGIPPSKNIIRRHLSTEFDALILPARATLGQGIRSGCGIVPLTGPGGLQHYASTDRRSTGSLRISAWKGSQSSLSKAFRFNTKSSRSGSSIGDRASVGNSTSPTPSFSSSEGGGGIYATVGAYPYGSQTYQQQQQQQYSNHHYPPPTTAPPPPPPAAVSTPSSTSSQQQLHHYQQQQFYIHPHQQQQQQQQQANAHRISAPPAGTGLDTPTDSSLLYEQHRRVKSISDIGATAASAGGSTVYGTSNRDRMSGISGLSSMGLSDTASIASSGGLMTEHGNHLGGGGSATESSNSPV
uniref:SAM domain-containing protein n=1 Tax=Musca domestica TaxID=7370 RepID=A0A1I8MU83_MUSDO